MRQLLLLMIAAIALIPSCGGDDDNKNSDPPPAGACRTGGSATGSYESACNSCAQQRCNAELSDQAGSGWAKQYFGGNGACAAFYACTCSCLATQSNPAPCATTSCVGELTQSCQSAVLAAQDCLEANCADECR